MFCLSKDCELNFRSMEFIKIIIKITSHSVENTQLQQKSTLMLFSLITAVYSKNCVNALCGQNADFSNDKAIACVGNGEISKQAAVNKNKAVP
jgi:hypothetical protein